MTLSKYWKAYVLAVFHLFFWLILMPYMISADNDVTVILGAMLILAVFPASYYFMKVKIDVQ